MADNSIARAKQLVDDAKRDGKPPAIALLGVMAIFGGFTTWNDEVQEACVLAGSSWCEDHGEPTFERLDEYLCGMQLKAAALDIAGPAIDHVGDA